MLIDTLPAALKPLARAWARKGIPDTKTARADAVRAAAGARNLTANIEATMAAAQEIDKMIPRTSDAYYAARVGRDRLRMFKRTGNALWIDFYRGPSLPQPSGRPAVLLPTGTPAARLKALRIAAVSKAQTWRAGTNDEVSVAFTSDPAEVGLHQAPITDWNKYKGKFKGWACHYLEHTITVPTDWRVRVQRRGLAKVDGMMTLDAAPMAAPVGVELFAAVWVVQGRGNNAEHVRGYIARRDGQTYHASTAADAIAGVTRKAQRAAAAAEWHRILASADLAALVAQAQGMEVDVADARAIGACEYGIKSWCHATGLPYEAGHAPIEQVFAAYQRQPRTEARAAILHALRVHRRALLKAA